MIEAAPASTAEELPYVGATKLRDLLTLEGAIAALEDAFSQALPAAPMRHHHVLPESELLLMPAWGTQGVGVKLMALTEANPSRGRPFLHGLFALFAADDQRPLAVIDGAALTALRTAAVSALATKYLARPDATSLVIFGAGRQASEHLHAMLQVRALETVAIVDPDRRRAERLADTAEAAGVRATLADASVVSDADLVCLCTTSSEPVFAGELLPDGVHVNAMGAYRPDLRELDEVALKRCRVFVETREVALAEAGDLLIPMSTGAWSSDAIQGDIADLVAGKSGRESTSERTLMKTVGVAFEDLVVASAAVHNLAGS